MIVDGSKVSDKAKLLMNQFDANHFHQHIKELYRLRFSDDYIKISALKKKFNGYTESI